MRGCVCFGQGEIQGSQEEGAEEDTSLPGARAGAGSRGVSTWIVPIITYMLNVKQEGHFAF